MMTPKKTSRMTNKPVATRKAGTPRCIETPQQLRAIIKRLSPASPVTNRFSAAWRRKSKIAGQKEANEVWYRTQHEHWLGWLAGWSGPGAYGRQNWSRSAAFVYNHIVNPQMLIYLAEATHIPKHELDAAVAAALASCKTMSAMSGAIRRAIPWRKIEQALLVGQ